MATVAQKLITAEEFFLMPDPPDGSNVLPDPPNGLDPLPEPPDPLPALLLEDPISTPRKAVAPMCTSAEALPASICLAMETASLIGIA